jgi:hypothetical protein
MHHLSLRGRTIQRGQTVVAVIAAANRDPERFDQPDAYDVHRRNVSHLGFGTGIHVCLGANLARTETDVALTALLRRLPDLRLENGRPEWKGTFVLRGLKALPVALSS